VRHGDKNPARFIFKKNKMEDVIQKKQVELTDASLWKPILQEINRIQEQRAIIKSTALAVGVD